MKSDKAISRLEEKLNGEIVLPEDDNCRNLQNVEAKYDPDDFFHVK
ncbi:hypothetical protein [Rhodohalobacter sp. SW132]|nr:hypothetical protein [Rhodohalobacter sp. SW132]